MAVMSFDYGQAEVWLDDRTGPIDPGAGYAMCDRHADRLTPPRGWLLTDRRSIAQPLFVSFDVA